MIFLLNRVLDSQNTVHKRCIFSHPAVPAAESHMREQKEKTELKEERKVNMEANDFHTTAADPEAAAFSGTQQEMSGDYVIPLIPGRTYKDTVFNYLFRHKKEALSLYNAINGTHLTDPEELRIVTLDTGIYLSYKNDVAFMIGDELNLYEQQSTEDPNMPHSFDVRLKECKKPCELAHKRLFTFFQA